MRRLFAAIQSVLGVDELLFMAGLALLTVGLWPALQARALAVPGVILLWISLPSRRAFLERPPAAPQSSPRRKT